MNEYMVFIWIGLGVLLGLVEAFTLQLVSIWFAVAAFITVIPALMHTSPSVQILVFVVSAAVLLVCTRPFVKRAVHMKKESTNADMLIGQPAQVVETIDNAKDAGKVHISGLDWTARTVDGRVAEPGDCVIVDRIEGVKLIVRADAPAAEVKA